MQPSYYSKEKNQGLIHIHLDVCSALKLFNCYNEYRVPLSKTNSKKFTEAKLNIGSKWMNTF